MRTYRGSCHCGAVRFEFRSEELTRGLRCNCSICIRRGALMSKAYVPREDFLVLQGLESMSVYRFGDRTVNHFFCGTCGIYPFHEIIRKPGQYRVNLLCLEDLDPLSVEVDWVDGRSF